MLMAMVNVVLKWKTSTTYQSHIYESFDLNFGKVYDVTRFTNQAKFGKDRISGGAPHVVVNCTGSVPFIINIINFYGPPAQSL